ncbi:hypothetical protein EDD66_103255 [Mobilisporobacter senegalensis]|uniref:Aminoacetone oxidase family FAD-binding enzyme n=1 Tax=Mobilisporobacter senegalensis TaxID=1329262 RepID=A0A3N1XRM6_9FIRM|nr:NAD(P)/FAD-dependent oxidoreductase [Mobilisporobacter senegalensis]ROR29319.1 hypothetical protein EDD66_103255 [Mobilisporobacter senegalensis]
MASDIIVVGGGASGLVAAIAAARAGRKVTILEHKDRIGKKILATGNGKCNYTNLHQEPSCYRGEDPAFAWNVINDFGVEDTITFFKELGIYPKERNGYLYPNSEQASAVLDVLRLELEFLNVEIICNEHVKSIQSIIDNKGKPDCKNIFRIKTDSNTYDTHKIILATGGMASGDLGSDGSGYLLAKQLGHTIVPVVPALVQLKSKESYFKALAGIRVQSMITLFIDGKQYSKNQGELQLTNYGVSGIPIFEISRYASRALEQRKKVHLIVDFLPGIESDELFRLIEERVSLNGYKNVEELFIGLLNKKLIFVIIKEAKIDLNKLSIKLNKKEINELVNTIKNFKVSVYEANSFGNAQVSAGGVSTEEVDNHTMESKLVQGLYLVGELLDIDGTCGGYNLQWAWSSGYIAGTNAAK